MPRAKRQPLATLRCAIRYNENNTRAKCRTFVDEHLQKHVFRLIDAGITWKALEKLDLRVSTSRKEYDELDCEIYYYVYDITGVL